MYSASGQTDAGRYLIVFFIHKQDNTALILSARDMDKKEKVMKESEDTQTHQKYIHRLKLKRVFVGFYLKH